MIKALIFDFDGVLVESVDIKTEAFRELFKEYSSDVDELIEYHTFNGGVSRFVKIRYFFERIRGEKLSEKTFNEYCLKFSRLVVDKVVKAPYVAGAEELLNDCFGKYQMYVISGTPNGEIRSIVKERSMGRFFKDVFGSPNEKKNLVKTILGENDLHSSEAIFIGDSRTDAEAAQENDIGFIARVANDEEDWYKDFKIFRKFNNLEGVYAYLSTLNKDM